MNSLFTILGLAQYGAAWADLTYWLIAFAVFGVLFVRQYKAAQRGLMVEKLKGTEVGHPFKEHPIAYRCILAFLCWTIAIAWPFFFAFKLYQWLETRYGKLFNQN